MENENREILDNIPDFIRCDYTLEAADDSMINARIFPGDIVCIDSLAEISSGDIIAVSIGDSPAFLQRIMFQDGYINLISENPKYKTRKIGNEELKQIKLRIIGKAVYLIAKIN